MVSSETANEALQAMLDKAREEGMNTGLKSGWEKGFEEGRQEATMNEFIPQTVKLIQQAERTRILGIIEEIKKPIVPGYPSDAFPDIHGWNSALSELKRRLEE